MANESSLDRMTRQSVSGMSRRQIWFLTHCKAARVGGWGFHSRQTANESSLDQVTTQSVSGMSRREIWFLAHSKVILITGIRFHSRQTANESSPKHMAGH